MLFYDYTTNISMTKLKYLSHEVPLTVTTVSIEIPEDEWYMSELFMDIDKFYRVYAAERNGTIYLKPNGHYSSWEWEQIFGFGIGGVGYDAKRIVQIKTKATLT